MTTRGPWECFHCWDVFTDERAARLHFGEGEEYVAACQIKGSEGGLIEALRKAEASALDAWGHVHGESAEGMKAYASHESRHRTAVRSAEETGFERGVDQTFGPIRELLAKVDAVGAACPYKSANPPNSRDRCPKCNAGARDGCYPAGNAAGDFVAAVRELIEGKAA